MATGLVGTVAGNTSLTYTAASNAKVAVAYYITTTAGITVNGGNLGPSGASGTSYFYVGRGQSLTVSVAAGGGNAVVSALEEAS